MEKMKKNKAGHYIPTAYANEIVSAIKAQGLPDDFADGAAFALSYVSCPKDQEMHGAGIADYINNAMVIINDKALRGVINEADKIIEWLKDHGLNVTSAYIVRGDV